MITISSDFADKNVDYIDHEGKEFTIPPQTAEEHFANSIKKLDFTETVEALFKYDGSKLEEDDSMNNNIHDEEDQDAKLDQTGPLFPAATALRTAQNEFNLMVNLLNMTTANEKDAHLKLEEIGGYEISNNKRSKANVTRNASEEKAREDNTHDRERTSIETMFGLKRDYFSAAASILKEGSINLNKILSQERRCLDDLIEIRRKWNIKAPAHGPEISPLRSSEPLVVDSGSQYTPSHGNLADHVEAEIIRNLDAKVGGLTIRKPTSFEDKTVRITLIQYSGLKSEIFSLKLSSELSYSKSKIQQHPPTQQEQVRNYVSRSRRQSISTTHRSSGNTSKRNAAILSEIQKSLVSSELFYILKQGAAVYKHTDDIIHVNENEITIQLNENSIVKLDLISKKSEDIIDKDNGGSSHSALQHSNSSCIYEILPRCLIHLQRLLNELHARNASVTQLHYDEKPPVIVGHHQSTTISKKKRSVFTQLITCLRYELLRNEVLLILDNFISNLKSSGISIQLQTIVCSNGQLYRSSYKLIFNSEVTNVIYIHGSQIQLSSGKKILSISQLLDILNESFISFITRKICQIATSLGISQSKRDVYNGGMQFNSFSASSEIRLLKPFEQKEGYRELIVIQVGLSNNDNNNNNNNNDKVQLSIDCKLFCFASSVVGHIRRSVAGTGDHDRGTMVTITKMDSLKDYKTFQNILEELNSWNKNLQMSSSSSVNDPDGSKDNVDALGVYDVDYYNSLSNQHLDFEQKLLNLFHMLKWV